MKKLLMSCVMLSVAGFAAEIDQTAETLKVSVTPSQPYTLHDGKATIAVKTESINQGRGERSGTVQVLMDGSTLTVVPGLVIYAGAHRYEFNKEPSFVFGHVRESDMIFTVVERCNLSVRSSKQAAPVVPVKKLAEEIEVLCKHGMMHDDLYTVKGEGSHFIALKPSSASISRFHPDPELGARLKLDVISNFGSESITLDYKKKKVITLGPETITLQSSGFDYKTKTMKVQVSSEPGEEQATPVILRYGS